MKKTLYIFTLFLLIFSNILSAQIVVKDGDLNGNNTYNWTSDNVYLLDGFVYLEDGGILNIEAGTVIKGKETPTTGDNASALIISRGAQINAIGSADAPVIFTAEIDDTDDAYDLDVSDRGLWGGLIILGKANIGDTTPEKGVEGIPAGETRALYGGTEDNDNSGELKYVSIRHGGAELAPGDEINGLTLGAVGSATKMDYIEVFSNSDDGIEFFGGTVDLTHACVAYCGDDSFDWDTGFRGKGQFWFSLQGSDEGDNGAECDGAKPDDNALFSQPFIYNATFIGSGAGADAKNEHAVLFRDGTGGGFSNSIFTSFTNYAIQIEDLVSGLDSRQRLENGEIAFNNNIWWSFGTGSALTNIIQLSDAVTEKQWLIDHLGNNNNTIEDPQLGTISRIDDGQLDPRPSNTGAAYNGLAPYSDDFYRAVNYKGAFCSEGVWIKDWTAVSEYGILDATVGASVEDCEVSSVKDFHKNGISFIAAPNPAQDIVNLTLSLKLSATVSIAIYDVLGKNIHTILRNENLHKGTYNFEVNVDEIPNGLYYYSVQNGQEILTNAFVVKH